MRSLPLTVVDVETGGLNPETDALLSVGIVSLQTGEERYLEILPFPDAHISDQALAINGFTREQCFDRWRCSEHEAAGIISRFFSFQPRTIAGENPSFDLRFLEALFKRTGQPWIFGHRTFDTHTLAMAHMLQHGIEPPQKNNKSDLNLDGILEYCGLESRPGTHNALEDARLEARAILRLLYV